MLLRVRRVGTHEQRRLLREVAIRRGLDDTRAARQSLRDRVGIALDVKGMLTYGMSVREIRAAIDAKWASAGPGTPTPLP